MRSSRSLSIFCRLPIIFNLLAPAISQDPICPDRAYYCWRCSHTATNASGDTYRQNLKNLLSSFSTNTTIDYGFYNSSLGQDPDKVNAIALCRGDLGLISCQECLNDTTQILFQNCPNQPEAIIWSEPCMVRYSYNLIFGSLKEGPRKYLPSPHSTNNSEQFNLVLNPLLAILSERAAAGDSCKKFAAGHAIVPGGGTIFSTAQCTPDIDKQNCSNCLKEAASDIPACCAGKTGARVLKPSCNLRFEAEIFYDPTAGLLIDISVPVPAGSPAPKQENKCNRKNILIIIVAVVLIVFVSNITSICILLRLMKRRVKLEDEDENSDDISLVESLQYGFETTSSATDDFSEVKKQGRGGSGAVYKLDFERREKEIRDRGEEVTPEVRNQSFAPAMGPKKNNVVRGYGIGVHWKDVPDIVTERGGISREVQKLKEACEGQRQAAIQAKEEVERIRQESNEIAQRLKREQEESIAKLREEQAENLRIAKVQMTEQMKALLANLGIPIDFTAIGNTQLIQ